MNTGNLKQIDGKTFIASAAPIFEMNENTAGFYVVCLRRDRLLPKAHKHDNRNLNTAQAVTTVLALLASPTASGAPSVVRAVVAKPHIALCLQSDGAQPGSSGFKRIAEDDLGEQVRRELQARAFAEGSLATFPGTFAADLAGFIQAWLDTGSDSYLPSVKVTCAGEEASCEIAVPLDPARPEVQFIIRYGDDLEGQAPFARQYLLHRKAVRTLFADFGQAGAE